MNEAEVNQAMSEALIGAGHSRQQVTAWQIADRAAADAPDASSSVPTANADDWINHLVSTGQYSQADAAHARQMEQEMDDHEQSAAASPDKAAAPTALDASGMPDPFDGVELQDGFGPPAKSTDYRLDSLVAEQLSVEQLRNLGETLLVAKLPAGIGVQIVSEIASVGAMNLDEAGRELMTKRTMVRLEALWGEETATKINTARKFLQQLDKARPGVLRMLEDSGAGSSYAVIRQVVEHASRINGARRL